MTPSIAPTDLFIMTSVPCLYLVTYCFNAYSSAYTLLMHFVEVLIFDDAQWIVKRMKYEYCRSRLTITWNINFDYENNFTSIWSVLCFSVHQKTYRRLSFCSAEEIGTFGRFLLWSTSWTEHQVPPEGISLTKCLTAQPAAIWSDINSRISERDDQIVSRRS